MRGHSRLEAASLVLFTVLGVLPVLASVAYAAFHGLGLAGLFGSDVTLAHARAVLAGRDLWASLGLSAYVAALVTLLTVALSLPLALRLRRRLESGALSNVLALPLAVPGTVAGLLAFQGLSAAGLVSRVTWRIGLTRGVHDFPELVNDRFALGIVLTHVALAVPFVVLLLVELYASERLDRFLELASSLKARPGQALWRVTLPVLLQASAPALTLIFVFVLGSYEIPLLLGRQAPQMVSVLVMRKFALFDLSRKPEAFIAALLYTLVVVALVGLASRRAVWHHAE